MTGQRNVVVTSRKEDAMGTQAQIAANRRNGKKGGVKTQEGKMKSRLNARKHGIFANALTRDDEGQVAAIHGKLVAELNPGTVVEKILVDKMAVTVLRLERCARMEAVWLEQAPTPFEECPVTDQRDWHELTRQERKQRDAEEERRSARRSLHPQDREGGPMHVAGRWLDQIKLLNRYDTALTNQFLKILHEIQGLQAMRCERDAARAMVTPQPTAAQGEPPAQGVAEAPDDAGPLAENAALRNEPNPDAAENAPVVSAAQAAAPEGAVLRNEPNPDVTDEPRAENEEPQAASAPALRNEPNSS